MTIRPSWPAAAVAAALGVAIAIPADAAQTVLWATYADTPLGAPAPAMVGSPDLAWQTSEGRAAKFEQRVDYPTLAAAMGLSATEFGRYDVIAWEANGGAPGGSGGWESVRLVFDDLHVALVARYDEVTGLSDNPAVQFRTGSIDGSAYDGLFGTRGANPVMSWLLVDLPGAIDARSPAFSIRYAPGGLSAGGLGQGSPDLDAIGVIASVPEPGTLASVALALLAMGAVTRRRT